MKRNRHAIEVEDGLIVTILDEISEWRNQNGGRELVTVYSIWENSGDSYTLLGRKRKIVKYGRLSYAKYAAKEVASNG